MYNVVKGTRVRVRFFQPNLRAGIAGAQLKFVGKEWDFVGTVRHIRGDAPTFEESKDIRIFIQPDVLHEGLETMKCDRCGCNEVEVGSANVLGIEP